MQPLDLPDVKEKALGYDQNRSYRDKSWSKASFGRRLKDDRSRVVRYTSSMGKYMGDFVDEILPAEERSKWVRKGRISEEDTLYDDEESDVSGRVAKPDDRVVQKNTIVVETATDTSFDAEKESETSEDDIDTSNDGSLTLKPSALKFPSRPRNQKGDVSE